MLPDDFWVISDTHFFHNNIVNFCDRNSHLKRLIGPSQYKKKPVDHNTYMVERWNAVVGKDDPILHLGDVAMGRGDSWSRFEFDVAPRLNGDKYLILGNHDDDRRDWAALGFTVIGEFGQMVNNKTVTFSHYPLDPDHALGLTSDERHVHGHIHNNGYAIISGEHGWRHGTTDTSRNQINVSVEVIDYTPQKLSSLIK